MNDTFKLPTPSMELTESNIQNIIIQSDNFKDPFTLVYPIVNNFIEKYKSLKVFNEKFINDLNKLFNLLYVVFNKQYQLILEEINKEDNTIQYDKKEQHEFELYEDFIRNLKYISENISNIKDENEFSNNKPLNEKIKSTIEYLEKNNNDMKRLNESMNRLKKSLEETYNLLKPLNEEV